MRWSLLLMGTHLDPSGVIASGLVIADTKIRRQNKPMKRLFCPFV